MIWKKHPSAFWFTLILVSIGLLMLAWPPLPTQAGPELPNRATPTPFVPPLHPPGSESIELWVQDAPAGVWTVVQWQDGLRDWHDVEGWQGTLDEANDNEGKKVWWFDKDDFGGELFRWLIYQQQDGSLLATSESFYLPTTTGEAIRVDVTISPSLPAASTLSSPGLVENEYGGSWTSNVYTAHIAGTWIIRGSYNGYTADVVLNVKPGEQSYIVVTPDMATIAAGDVQTYTVEAFDGYDNSLGDVTLDTIFTVVESEHNGYWTGETYTAHTAGEWTVRGFYNDHTADVVLSVEPAELSYILVSPDTITVTAGSGQTCTAEAFDAYDNSLGDVTLDTTFTILESGHNGQWSANRYIAHTAGEWTIRGDYNNLTADADLVVEPAGLSYVLLSPDTLTVIAGNDGTYTAKAFDFYDNSLGDVTADTIFSIVESGHNGHWTSETYTAHTAGIWTVRGVYNSLIAGAELTVEPAGSSYIVIAPDTADMIAGNEQTYVVEAFDAYDNPLGDVTADTAFSIVESGHNGHWTDEIYTAHTAGTWMVRGVYDSLTADADLTVEPGELSYIVITPNKVTVAAGDGLAFTAEAFDAYGNSLGDVTDDTIFDAIESEGED